MKNILIAIVSIFIGAFGMYMYINKKPIPAMEMNESMDMTSMMNVMNGDLVGKTGDTLDKAFIASMIVHHQGAVKMSEVVARTSAHPELRTFANNIITAQNKEIETMKKWQTEWYK